MILWNSRGSPSACLHLASVFAVMETIEVPMHESLLAEVDCATEQLSMTRADFARLALELALRNQKTIALERQHAQGYSRCPATPGEFDDWEPERVWSEP